MNSLLLNRQLLFWDNETKTNTKEQKSQKYVDFENLKNITFSLQTFLFFLYRATLTNLKQFDCHF